MQEEGVPWGGVQEGVLPGPYYPALCTPGYTTPSGAPRSCTPLPDDAVTELKNSPAKGCPILYRLGPPRGVTLLKVVTVLRRVEGKREAGEGDGIGRCLDSGRSRVPIITLETDSRGGSLECCSGTTRARRTPGITTFAQNLHFAQHLRAQPLRIRLCDIP